MKVCLSNKQSKEYLLKAQEISFDYTDRKKIPEFIDEYPNKDIILIHYSKYDIDWDEILDFNYLAKGHFILGTDSIYICKKAKEKNIKFFYNRRVCSFLEVTALEELGSCYLIPGEPIFFQMELLSLKGIPIRIIPNLVFLETELYKDGVLGSWIRPEDMFMYKKYVSAIEFYTADSENPTAKERGLYRVYIQDEEWPDELSLLITGLNYEGNNGLINSESTAIRLNCGQRCQHNSSCNLCYQVLNLANTNKMKEILNKFYEEKELEK